MEDYFSEFLNIFEPRDTAKGMKVSRDIGDRTLRSTGVYYNGDDEDAEVNMIERNNQVKRRLRKGLSLMRTEAKKSFRIKKPSEQLEILVSRINLCRMSIENKGDFQLHEKYNYERKICRIILKIYEPYLSPLAIKSKNFSTFKKYYPENFGLALRILSE